MANRFLVLDRDGILNEDKHHVFKPEDITIPEGIVPLLKVFQQQGYRFVVVTNQSGLARQYFSVAELTLFNTELAKQYATQGIILEKFYHCPHLEAITGKCLCRKPNGLLVEKAIAKFDMNVPESFMIGDNPRDVTAGKSAGLNTILIHDIPHTDADFCFASLLEVDTSLFWKM